MWLKIKTTLAIWKSHGNFQKGMNISIEIFVTCFCVTLFLKILQWIKVVKVNKFFLKKLLVAIYLNVNYNQLNQKKQI